MLKMTIKAQGTLHIILTDKNGHIKKDVTVPNIVVDTGLEFIARRMLQSPFPADFAAMSHMAIGTDDDTLDPSEKTELGDEVARSVIVSSSVVQQTQVQYTASFLAGVGTGPIVEAGIFNDTTAGRMLCRTTFPVINKESDDTLSITWTIQILPDCETDPETA